ncbi:MAG TPA: DPP IV N-terminal domain-containing protein [Gemmatimonadota bacterium]|nr:DPP IV N-terminal domain-containing protein [Gemmatimonadota bacterium]
MAHRRPDLASHPRILLVTLLLLLAAAAPLSAQYSRFGKNKVQYDDFNWEILTGEHVDLYYYPEERELALVALAYAEESFQFLEQKFSYSPKDRIPLVVYASHQHFEQTNIVPFFIPEGVAGFTEFLKGRVALPFNGSYADFRRVIRHELVHVFQARKGSHIKRLHPGGYEWNSPFWFSEGLAEYWSGPWSAEGDLVVRDLLLNGRVPHVSKLDQYAGSFAAYKLGQNLFEFLGQEFGEERVVELMESEWKYRNFSTAFRRVYGITTDELTERWHRHLMQRYFPTLAAERSVSTVAEPVVTQGRLNFTPAVLPAGARDGKESGIAFLSLESGYTTINTADLMRPNRHIDTVVTAGRSGDMESFHPLQSTIDVSDGGWLTFVAKSGPRDAVYVYDVESGDREREASWDDLVVLSSPTWSPDGRQIAFVGLSEAGFSDLYVWNTETGRRERLTDDRYLEATPSWSPDGDAIVFSSDRTPFGADGARNLFLIDARSRTVRPLTFGRWVDRDPDWSPDGRRILFSSDRSGTLDLYFVDREGNGSRATWLAAGVMHPRWFRAGGKDYAVFTAYENMSYAIYRVEIPAEVPTTLSLAVDPDLPQWAWEIPDDGPYVQREYEKEFGLDFASAALAFAEDGSRAEGAQVFFSDLLGDHVMIGQVNSQQGRTNLFSGFTGAFTYVNLKNRLNWGVSGYRFKSYFESLLGDEFGGSVPSGSEGVGFRSDFFEERWGATGILMYPFSKFQRIEAEFTVERNSIDESSDSGDFFRDAWLAIPSLGYVFDNTLWGPAGPIDGQRLNFTVSPVTNVSEGGMETLDVLLDARKYFRTSQHTTLAIRARGRLSHGDIPTFYYLGGPLSLRGYPRYTLNGSRTVLLNQEWRFPILPPDRFRSGPAVLLANGIWGAFFVDLGNAWVEDTRVENSEGELVSVDWPGLLGAYGATIKYPLIGPLILRFDWARRFDINDRRDLFPGEQNDVHFSFFVGYDY